MDPGSRVRVKFYMDKLIKDIKSRLATKQRRTYRLSVALPDKLGERVDSLLLALDEQGVTKTDLVEVALLKLLDESEEEQKGA